MSKYTTELRYICETEAGLQESEGANNVDQILVQSAPKIFNFAFPIFDENYRLNLETKILKHYYTREIGEETYGLWKLRLNSRLNEIMPYYNKLYESELYQFNPFDDVDLTREHTRQQDEEMNTHNDGITNRALQDTHMYSDTPQGEIDNLLQGKYLTNASIDSGTGNVSTQNNGAVNSDMDMHFIETLKGKMGLRSYSSLLKEYRTILLNIDMQIINDLSDLFINLW